MPIARAARPEPCKYSSGGHKQQPGNSRRDQRELDFQRLLKQFNCFGVLPCSAQIPLVVQGIDVAGTEGVRPSRCSQIGDRCGHGQQSQLDQRTREQSFERRLCPGEVVTVKLSQRLLERSHGRQGAG